MSDKPQKLARILASFGLLAVVGYLDYVTGYKVTVQAFYLIPILVSLRFVGERFAFSMAVIAAGAWLAADIASGDRYPDYLAPLWNTGIHLSIFLLVVVLFSNRRRLQELVDMRTRELRMEIQMRSRLEKELLEIAEAEQRRIGQDLHDVLGQHLTATALAGKVLAKRMASKSAVEPAKAEHLVNMVEEAIDLARNLARMLHPLELGAEGLENALRNLAANLSDAFSVSCRFESSGTVVLKDALTGMQLYRVAQEAATNAIRHGGAKNIVISLETTRKILMLSVTDDGSGLTAEARTKKGMGLKIMDYRAKMVGGSFDIQNHPGGGARAVCLITESHADNEDYGTQNSYPAGG